MLPAIWRLLETAERTFDHLKFPSAAARGAAGLIEVARLRGQDCEELIARRQKYRAILTGAGFPENFAEEFEPMDWKLLFLAEL